MWEAAFAFGNHILPGLAFGEGALQVVHELRTPAVDEVDMGKLVVFEQHCCVHERDIEALPLSSPLPVVKRRRNAPRHEHGGGIVDDRVQERFWAVLGHVSEPGERLYRDVHPGQVGHRAVDTVGGVLPVDNPRVGPAHRLVVESDFGSVAGPEVGEDDVR